MFKNRWSSFLQKHRPSTFNHIWLKCTLNWIKTKFLDPLQSGFGFLGPDWISIWIHVVPCFPYCSATRGCSKIFFAVLDVSRGARSDCVVRLSVAEKLFEFSTKNCFGAKSWTTLKNYYCIIRRISDQGSWRSKSRLKIRKKSGKNRKKPQLMVISGLHCMWGVSTRVRKLILALNHWNLGVLEPPYKNSAKS